MNTIDIVIPTMWCDENFISYLEKYCSYTNINQIYLIDNQKQKRPNKEILNHPKIKIICYNKNIYVNPAWNEGYYRSNADVIGLFSDDVFVEEDIFDFIADLDMKNIDIIGSYLKGSIDNYHIVDHPDQKEKLIKVNLNRKQPIGGQCYAFGVCMFMKRSSYKVIPSLYKIWFGDDYLVQNSKNVYALRTNKIKGEISKTLISFDKTSYVNKRLELDKFNAYQFGNFGNGQNWSMIMQQKQPIKFFQ